MITAFLFFIVALIYSSAGLAGGSSYLALLFLLDYPVEQVAAVALVCNIVVSFIGTNIFTFSKQLNFRSLQWFLLGSIPAAYVGGSIQFPKETLRLVLGLTLLFTSLWILATTFKGIFRNLQVRKTPSRQIALGGGVGLLAGLVGIGGGIFLAPVLILFQWEEAKKVSAITSAFILFNSISGIFGKLSGLGDLDFIFDYQYLVLAVAFGGLIGPSLSLRKFSPVFLKRNTALIIFVASLRLVFNF